MKFISKLVISLFFTGCLVIAELTLGHFTHCLTLLVVTNQSIQNLITIASSMISEKLSGSNHKRWSYGYSRLPILGLFGSQIFLFSMCFATTVETLQTLFHIQHLDVMHYPSQVCILAGVHFGVWILVFFLLGGNTNHQLFILSQKSGAEANLSPWHFIWNCRLSHLLRDLLCCMSLVLATGIIMLLSLYSVEPRYIIYVDPCFALLTILILLASQCSFIKTLCKTILQGQMETDGEAFLRSAMEFEGHLKEKYPSVLGVHEFHYWYLTPSKDVLTSHILFKNEEDGQKDFIALKAYLESQILHVAIQPEFQREEQEEEYSSSPCVYQCPNPSHCNPQTCCPTTKENV